MNKEHFLIELKIYLKSLSTKQQMTILNKYEELFNERLAMGETEEQIAKELGKPKTIAEEILKEFNIDIAEKKMVHDGWEEISPQKNSSEKFEYGDYYNFENDDDPYNESQSYSHYRQPVNSPFVRVCQVVGILALNFLLMIWVIFAMIMVFFSMWLASTIFIVSPILGIYSMLANMGDYGMLQLFASILFFGIGIIGSLILIPLTKWFAKGLKHYFKWNLFVLRGGA